MTKIEATVQLEIYKENKTYKQTNKQAFNKQVELYLLWLVVTKQ